MISQVSQPRLKGFRLPRSIISYAVWAYHRFALSLRNFEDRLAARGVIVSNESIRVWCQRFGVQIWSGFVGTVRYRPTKWQLAEVVIPYGARNTGFGEPSAQMAPLVICKQTTVGQWMCWKSWCKAAGMLTPPSVS